MGKLVVSQFMSIDGVVGDPGGAEDTERGGWAFKYERGEEGDKFKLNEVMDADALLLGRTTYEGFAAAWPSRSGDFADKFNGMTKYVVTSTITDPDWNNTKVIDGNGDIAGAVEKAKGSHEGDILVNGSTQLLPLLFDSGLVDELRLMVFPTVLGSGKRLVSETGSAAGMKLTDSRPAGETTILIYQPAGS